MSKFAKTAIAAAMVMGAVVSSSAFAAGNNGTARFYGTIEDSPCSIVPDDHKLEVDMGDIGAAKLTGGGTTTPKDFQIRLQDCVFTTETNMETTFTGTNKPLVMPPKTSQPLKAKMASAPVLTYINDYGARMPLIFRCEGNTCKVDEDQSSKG